MQTAIAEMLAKRRDRAIAIILGVKEREIDAHLPKEAQAKLRKVILDQVNDLFDVAMELMASLDSGESVVNQLWLDKVDILHQDVSAMLVKLNGNGSG